LSTVFVPKVTEASVENVVITEATISNLPPVGTRLRATLGESVVIGTVRSDHTQGGLLVDFLLDAEGYHGFRDVTLWLAVGWTFEILDTPEDAA